MVMAGSAQKHSMAGSVHSMIFRNLVGKAEAQSPFSTEGFHMLFSLDFKIQTLGNVLKLDHHVTTEGHPRPLSTGVVLCQHALERGQS